MPARCALSLHEFLAKNKIAAIAQFPSSPDLVPSDFILFLNLKMSLKGRRINDITMTEAKPQDTLADFHRTHVMKCFECWHDHLACCIKGDSID